MTRGWKRRDTAPDDTRQVLVALPDLTEVVAGEYVAETGKWYHANTNDEILPTLWREMPVHPFGGD